MKKLLSIILISNLFSIQINSNPIIPNNQISLPEKKYIKNRKTINKSAIRQIINTQDKTLKLPKISLCFSGGGYRSMVSSLGFLNATEENNLLHAARYISTLSGSTWLLIPLLIRNTIPSIYKSILKKRINTNFFNPKTLNLDVIIEYLKQKEKIELIDIWGSLLSDRLFGDIGLDGQNITFEEIRKNLNDNDYYPFPLFSCVIANSKDYKDHLPYNWLEINPYQSYSKELGASIETQYLGSTFKNGYLKQKKSELSAGFMMGIFGCPFCLTGGDIFNELLLDIAEYFNFKRYSFLEWFEKKFEILKFYKNRFCPGKIPNFTLGLKQSSLRKTKNLDLIDAAFSYNLPLPPLFRRNSDIIIICDASSDADIKNYPELKLASDYALNHDIEFPNIQTPYKDFGNMKIFFNEKMAHMPMIIYFANPIKEPTLKLKYNPQDFDKLHNAMENLVLENTKNIINAIKLKVKQLN